jgi:hypothetical protein
MHRYGIAGETHYAMATAPAMPADLAGVVLGLHNTHDFFKKPASRRTNARAYERRGAPSPHYTTDLPGPDGGLQAIEVLGPPDWATAYDVERLYSPGIGGKALDGTGVTIGIIGTAPVAASDIAAFRSTFQLPAASVITTLVPDTGLPAAGEYGAGLEAILDLEWSGGIATGADLNYVYVGEGDLNVDDAGFYLIEQNLAPVMSESYGGCEAGELPSDADVLEENGTAANLEGITYMAAAGDNGAADCIEQGLSGLYVDDPGAFPGVTAVGGTQFPSPAWSASGKLLAYPSSEQVWNESNDPYAVYMGQRIGVSVGGGGISSVFLRPAYQAGVAACTPNGTLPAPVTAPMRQIPDLALSAAVETPGYYVSCTFDARTQDCSATGGMPSGTAVGGTSAASPSFAGVVAILNQAVGERLGNINPILYQLEAAADPTSPFHDITAGTNEIACGPAGVGDAGGPAGGRWPDAGCGVGGLYGYAATSGYDCASGIGSIDAFNLVSAWLGARKTQTTLALTPDSTQEGAPVSLAAAVDVLGASAAPLTGNVTFAFVSYTPCGDIDLSWELGSVAIDDGTTLAGHADLSTAVPPGSANPGRQYVDVYALYGGDATHLPSQSPKVSLSFAPFDFAVVPATLTLRPDGTEDISTTGGVPPVRYYIDIDTTVSTQAMQGSVVDEDSGRFTAGPVSGYTEVAALDQYGAEAFAKVTVGIPSQPPTWVDTCIDAGVDASVEDGGSEAEAIDAGAALRKDGGPKDSGPKESGADAFERSDDSGIPMRQPSEGGCSCELAVGDRFHRAGWGDAVGLWLAVTFLARRRRT